MSTQSEKPLTKEDLLVYCRKYPQYGGALAHCFSDLRYAQYWRNLAVIELADCQRCVLTGRAKADADLRYVLPMNLDERTSISRLMKVFEALDPQPEKLTLGIVAKDSSIVYYNVQRGIISPKEAPDEA